jgi:hypothetical protein
VTIHIPRKIAIPLMALLGLGALAGLAYQVPDMWKYIREEGM